MSFIIYLRKAWELYDSLIQLGYLKNVKYGQEQRSAHEDGIW